MKEHIKSALITFFVAFALVLVASIDTFTLESFKDGTVVGVIFVAVRAGIKALLELFLFVYATYIKK